MTVQEIIISACELAGSVKNEANGDANYQISNAVALRYLNMVKDNFWSCIVNQAGEDYNYEEWTTDSFPFQSEYNTPNVAYNSAGAKMIKSVYIAYGDDTYKNTGELKYVKARLVSPSSLDKSWEWYKNEQSIDDPIYYIADNSIFIAPVPIDSQAGENRIKLTGIRKIPDYTMSTPEEEMRIPVDQHEVLVYGLIPYIYRKQGDIASSNIARQEYERIRKLAIQNLSERNEEPFYNYYPDEKPLNNNPLFD